MIKQVAIFRYCTIAGMVSVALLIGSLVFEAREAREAAVRIDCADRLYALRMAIYNYYKNYGTLPPAFVEDESGKRMHSWRVLVRKYVGISPLDYDFNNAWNALGNSEYIDESADGCLYLNDKGKRASSKDLKEYVYRPYVCPSNNWALTNNGFTNYVAIVDENTLWPGNTAYKSISENDFTEKDTILLMELPGSDIKWTEPRDITVEEAVELYREAKRGQIRAGNPHLLYITLGGKYGDVSSIPDEETFRKMLTVGKPVK